MVLQLQLSTLTRFMLLISKYLWDGGSVQMLSYLLMLVYLEATQQLRHICPIIHCQQNFKFPGPQPQQLSFVLKSVFLRNLLHLYLLMDLLIICPPSPTRMPGVSSSMRQILSREKSHALESGHSLLAQSTILDGKCSSLLTIISLILIAPSSDC